MDYSKDILKELLNFMKKFETEDEVTKVLNLFENNEQSKDFLLTLFKNDVTANKERFALQYEGGEGLDFLTSFKVFKNICPKSSVGCGFNPWKRYQ